MKKTDKNNVKEYVKQMAEMNDLPISPEYQAGVVENFERIAAIYQQVSEFTLPENIEAASTFEP